MTVYLMLNQLRNITINLIFDRIGIRLFIENLTYLKYIVQGVAFINVICNFFYSI